MESFKARMEQLRNRFVERTLSEREELRACLAAPDLGRARQILHSLAGNAGLFGFPAMGEAAAELEQALDRDASAEDMRPMLQRLMDEFAAAHAAAAPAAPPAGAEG